VKSRPSWEFVPPKTGIGPQGDVVEYGSRYETVSVDDVLNGGGVRCTDTGQVAGICTWAAQLRGKINPSDCTVHAWSGAVGVLSALENCGSERRHGVLRGAGEVRVDGESPSTFAEKGDLFRIAPKRVDVPLSKGNTTISMSLDNWIQIPDKTRRS
jgi:hypothetical protein